MIRFVIIGAVLGVAFTLFSIVDAAMSDAGRARGVSKPVWILICVLFPVIGGVLWFTVGKGQPGENRAVYAPDDDPKFSGISKKEMDRRIADLEDQLRALDDEVYPGELKSQAEELKSEAEKLQKKSEQKKSEWLKNEPEEKTERDD